MHSGELGAVVPELDHGAEGRKMQTPGVSPGRLGPLKAGRPNLQLPHPQPRLQVLSVCVQPSAATSLEGILLFILDCVADC